MFLSIHSIMNFLHNLLRYYHEESNGGLIVGGLFGGTLLVAGLLLVKFASSSLLRGLAIPLFIAGLFFAIAGPLSGLATRKLISAKVSLYQQDPQTFFRQERAHVDRIHHSWTGIRIGWTIVALIGLTILLTAGRSYIRGVGLGLLLFGLIGHIAEAFSYKRNERYREEVLQAAPHQDED